MQLGFVSAILPELSLEEVLFFAADSGYDCVEIMCWPKGKAERRYAGVTHLDLDELGEKDIARIQKLIKKSGITFSGLGYYPNPLTAEVKEATLYIKHIEKLIKAAAHLGLERINTFVGRNPALSVEDNWLRFLDVWRPLIDLATKHKIKVGIENCPMLFTNDEWPGGKNLATTPAIWRKMFADIPSPYFGLNYDPSHLIWQHMDYLKPIREFSSRFHHVHAKDVRINSDALNDHGIMAPPNKWHSPKLPGLGDVNWNKFFSALTDTGYQGPVCVEVEDRAYEGSLELRKKALVQSHTYLRQFIA